MFVVNEQRQLAELMSKCASSNIGTQTDNSGSDNENILNKLEAILSLLRVPVNPMDNTSVCGLILSDG